jgi:hypothetical protein
MELKKFNEFLNEVVSIENQDIIKQVMASFIDKTIMPLSKIKKSLSVDDVFFKYNLLKNIEKEIGDDIANSHSDLYVLFGEVVKENPELTIQKKHGYYDRITFKNSEIPTKKIKITDDFQKEFSLWVKKCQKMVDNYNKKNKYKREILRVSPGSRYWKVSTQDYVWAFVDAENGDVYKPASLRAPAKHARGNIFDKDNMSFVTPYGPKSLR